MTRCALMMSLFLATTACGSPNTNSDTAVEGTDEMAVEAKSEPIKLSEVDLLRVCKGGAAFRNGRKVSGIEAQITDKDIVRLSYTRGDGKVFRYDCKAESNALRYRMIDEAGPGTGPGTWSGRGSKTTFEIFPDSVEYTDVFGDGSSDTDRIQI